MRLQALQIYGIRNPYFRQHDGIAGATTSIAGRQLVNFDSYNYLGYSGDERVVADVLVTMQRHGTSASASRVASGERPVHRELEVELADALHAEDALVFTGGHATNVAAIGQIMNADDLVVHDELAHDSILQGIKLSGAARRSFPHGDAARIGELLRQVRHHYRKVLIAIEGVYSMDGDVADLPAFIALKHQHSFGVLGEGGLGIRQHHHASSSDVDLWMGTLSKSLASCGGWIAGARPLIDFLRYSAGGFVYSAGMTPQNTQAALSSLRLLRSEPWRVTRLRENSRRFYDGIRALDFDTGHARGESGIVPLIVGDSGEALLLAQRLNEAGINVSPIVHPAVADRAARLRFFLSSLHEPSQLDQCLETLAATRTQVKTELKRRRSFSATSKTQ
jgi:7-keto-8-aminopelargonate synthetase-like enzyme